MCDKHDLMCRALLCVKLLFLFYQIIHDCCHWALPISIHLLSLNTVLLRFCGVGKSNSCYISTAGSNVPCCHFHYRLGKFGKSCQRFVIWLFFALKLKSVVFLIHVVRLLCPPVCQYFMCCQIYS